MTDSETHKLLIAESSPLIANVLKAKLSEKGYEYVIYEDALEAFNAIKEYGPDCILIDKILGKITGPQLCALIKNSSFSSTPVVIYTAEGEINDFFLNNSGSDDIVSLSIDNIDNLLECLDDILNSSFSYDFLEDDGKDRDEDENPSICAINAMEKNRFYFNILRELFDFAPYITNLDQFTNKILSLLYEICKFDMAIFVYNQKPFMVYQTKVSNLDKSILNDFLKVCKSDFEANLDTTKNYAYVPYEMDVFPDEKDLQGKNFASYKCYPLIGDDFIGTIHLASTEKNFFRTAISDNILYFVEKASVMFDQALKYRLVENSEKQMRTAFSKFVPNEIIDDLLTSVVEKNNVVNEKRKVAILICDIRNFTTISEINEPENVVSFLNGYFTEMVKIIKKHGGTIDKFIGDAIMALFGAPVSYNDNAERALQAALEMTAFLPKVSTDLINFPEGLTFDVGTGIHYGEVIVGSIGCEEKSDYTVIGDSVNLSSRLEGLTKIYGSKIIVSQAVIDELNGKYNLLNVDTVKVKGKHTGVPIYRADLEPLPDGYTTNYSKGLSLYTSGAWNLALGYFEKASEEKENDKSAQLMIERCKEFIKNPPENWEGAISLTSK